MCSPVVSRTSGSTGNVLEQFFSFRSRHQLDHISFRNLKELPDIYDRRLKACNKLEGAENKLLKIAAKRRLKAQKEAGKEKGDFLSF